MSKRTKQQPKWFDDYVPEEVANSTLFKFVIKVADHAVEVDMRADLDIDYNIIQSQLEDAPSEFAYWAAMYSELKMQVAFLERKIKARRGKLVKTVLDDAIAAQVRFTDKQVQSVIEADNVLNKLEVQMLLLNKHAGKMYFMVEALKMKSDNLRSLAGFARIELGNS